MHRLLVVGDVGHGRDRRLGPSHERRRHLCGPGRERTGAFEQRVVEKLALREEGVAVRYLEIDGIWEDHVRYAITVEEWIERREELLNAWVR